MSADREPRWRSALGALLFLCGLWVWTRVSLESLPYTYHDLHYLLSLEGGYGPEPVEWVHPLFIPFLAALRRGLALFGFTGRLLVPLESFNLTAGALTLCALYAAAARRCRDSVAAAAVALGLGFSYGFWSGALRPDPYALAAACATAALLLLGGSRPASPGLRFAAAGVAAGLAFGFHAAALALLPAGAAAAWAEAGFSRRGARLLGVFALGVAAAGAAAYALLIAWHGVTWDYFRHISASGLFFAVEQLPGSSIYTSAGWGAQARGLAETIGRHGGGPAVLLAAEAAALVWLRRAGSARATAGALAGAAGFAFFFLINNNQNGFAYAMLLSAPLLLPAWLGAPLALRRWAGPLTLAAMAVGLPSAPLPDGPADDPLFLESRFLSALLRPGDLLVFPGCPFPELMYERRLNAVQAGELALPGDACVAPSAGPRALEGRLRYVLSRGRKAYFAPGAPPARGASGADRSGAQKRVQAFATREGGSADQARAASAILRGLEAAFVVDCGLRSPQGWAYCAISPRPGRSRASRPEAPFSPAPRERAGDAFPRLRARYLSAWLEETPDDPFVRRDAAALPAPPADRGAAARAAALVEEGIAFHRSGRTARAEGAFRAALRADPACVSAWMSLGTVLDLGGRHAEAVACYDRILALPPASAKVLADTLSARANALARRTRPDAAKPVQKERLP